ncbi:oligosaccharide flippase family protein [Wenzhouxiangella sp. XN24]|uniref:oligosaccharide flippase family protein n=1 Tax=Wenzhouxiangella sp. XN24 TaxID=2713569 RepID=UPI0013EABF7A|nr:oligosaccharide flippase family protein [Wenzhouxiangella sp. XN24]NGX16877.1 oligosaccharide flippase family protein [Wenzhouxiangella sp. XN24]
MLKAREKNRLIGGLRWRIVLQFSAQVLSWLVTLLVIRILTPADYGLAALSGIVTILALLVADVGLGAAIVQAKRVNRASIRAATSLVLMASLLLWLLAAAFAPLLGRVFEEPRLPLVITISMLNILFHALGAVPSALLSRHLRFKERSQVEFAGALTVSLSTLALALLGMGVWALILGTLTGTLLRSICFGSLIPITSWRPSANLGRAFRLVNFGVWKFLGDIAFYLCQKGPLIVIGKFNSTAFLGTFVMPQTLISMPIDKGMSILNQMSFATFSRVQSNIEDVRRGYLLTMKASTIVLAPVFVGLAVVGDLFVVHVLGENWLDAAFIMPIFSLAGLALTYLSQSSPILVGVGRPRSMLRNLLIRSGVLIGFVAPGAIRSSLEETALGFFAATWILAIREARAVCQTIGLSPLSALRPLLGSLGPAAFMGAFVLAVRHVLLSWGTSELNVLTASVVVGVLSYLALVSLLAPETSRFILRTLLARQKPSEPG